MDGSETAPSADRRRAARRAFLATRLVGFALDSALFAGAYLVACALRFDFCEPLWGWRATAWSCLAAWGVQAVALLAAGCYRLPWRRTGLLDLPRWALAFAGAAAVLAVLRTAGTPGVRLPYSVTVMAAVLGFGALFGARLLWRFYAQARRDEKKLLRRTECRTGDPAVIALLHGRTVLVTGAGGTIGSELVRQAALAGARCVVMVERGENALYEIDREMRGTGAGATCVAELADIADEGRMRAILAKWRPAVVLHAAAYKHVPMVEAHPLAGLRNNAVATRRLGEWCRAAGVARFVMISTDKAVNPVSAMGLTKRLAEILLLSIGGGPTVFSCVRFGNVLGSSGSVVPLFREQIAHRGPVTVTHPRMKRYFMSVEEAVGLVLEAAAMDARTGGGTVFTLDMGKPVRIVDLAEDMIRQAGYKPYVDVPIAFTGIRPGEKLFEELDVSEKSAFRTGNARIFVNREAVPARPVDAEEVAAFAAGEPGDDEVRAFLKRAVSGTWECKRQHG